MLPGLNSGLVGFSTNNKLKPQNVFATSLYTSVGSSQRTINNLNMSGYGGLTWHKSRGTSDYHYWIDTARESGLYLGSDRQDPEAGIANTYPFYPDGFSAYGYPSSTTAVAWSFRQAPGFFSIVVITGDGSGMRNVAHGLKTQPGFIIAKKLNVSENWYAFHRGIPNSFTNGGWYTFNNTDPFTTSGSAIYDANATYLQLDGYYNQNGTRWVFYLWAHNPDLIDCGTYIGSGTAGNPVVCGTGWRPQWLGVRGLDAPSHFLVTDTQRGNFSNLLLAGYPLAEFPDYDYFAPTANGFQVNTNADGINGANQRVTYVAIREPF